MLIYFIKFTFLLIVFALIYKINLEASTNLIFKRFFLLSSITVSILLPLISFNFKVETNVVIETKQKVFQQIPVLYQDIIVSNSTISYNYLLMAYISVALVFLFVFIKNLFHILLLKYQAKKVLTKFGKIAIHPNIVAPFTFYDTIFVNINDWKNNNIDKAILYHEKAHVDQKHSIDVILVELIKIVLWFHPLIYIYKRWIQENHEYLADSFSLSYTSDIKKYQHLILKYYAKDTNQIYLSSSIKFKNLKKRFIMMSNNKKNKFIDSLLCTIVILSIYLGLVGIDANATEIQGVERTIDAKIASITKSEINDKTQIIVAKPKQNLIPQNDTIILKYTKGKLSTGSFIYGLNQRVYNYTVDENLNVVLYDEKGSKQNLKNFIFKLQENKNISTSELNILHQSAVENENEVYTKVDKRSGPKEGLDQFMQNFAKEFNPPKNFNASELKFRLKFVVDTDGSFKNIEAVYNPLMLQTENNIKEITDEAIRTLLTMPNWEPAMYKGRVVMSNFTMPIVLRLNTDDSKI